MNIKEKEKMHQGYVPVAFWGVYCKNGSCMYMIDSQKAWSDTEVISKRDKTKASTIFKKIHNVLYKLLTLIVTSYLFQSVT